MRSGRLRVCNLSQRLEGVGTEALVRYALFDLELSGEGLFVIIEDGTSTWPFRLAAHVRMPLKGRAEELRPRKSRYAVTVRVGKRVRGARLDNTLEEVLVKQLAWCGCFIQGVYDGNRPPRSRCDLRAAAVVSRFREELERRSRRLEAAGRAAASPTPRTRRSPLAASEVT